LDAILLTQTGNLNKSKESIQWYARVLEFLKTKLAGENSAESGQEPMPGSEMQIEDNGIRKAIHDLSKIIPDLSEYWRSVIRLRAFRALKRRKSGDEKDRIGRFIFLLRILHREMSSTWTAVEESRTASIKHSRSVREAWEKELDDILEASVKAIAEIGSVDWAESLRGNLTFFPKRYQLANVYQGIVKRRKQS